MGGSMSIPNQEKWSAAERAVGQGHFDQAVRLLAQDAILDASGRRLAIDLHDRLTARCTHAIQANQWRTAIDSLGCLRDLEGSSSHVERLRADLETGLSSWVEQLIEADRFEEIEQLCRMAGSSKLELPSIEKIHSQISLIQGAKKLVALGRFAEAENSLQAYADSKGFFLGAIRKIQEGHEQAKKLLAELHRAAEANQWDVVLSTADKVLSISNRHPMAFSMRQRAIAELAAQGKKPRNRESRKEDGNCIQCTQYPCRRTLCEEWRIARGRHPHADPLDRWCRGLWPMRFDRSGDWPSRSRQSGRACDRR